MSKTKAIKISQRYKEALQGYLRWIYDANDLFLLPDSLPFDGSAFNAAQCMLQWESYGIEPHSTSEPELLAKYMQGKRLRDYTIKEWRDGCKPSEKDKIPPLFFAEEFYVGEYGFQPIQNDQEFESIFGRPPDKTYMIIARYYVEKRKKLLEEVDT